MKQNIKEKVLKDLFMIFPMEEADNLKYIRKSAEKIIETKYLGLKDIEKAIDLTLAEEGKEHIKLLEKGYGVKTTHQVFEKGKQEKLAEVGKVIDECDRIQDNLGNAVVDKGILKQKLGIK